MTSTTEAIDAVWNNMAGGADGWLKTFGYQQFATAIIGKFAPTEPDWSDSKTLPSEMWKNPLIPMNERLEIADGAVRFRNDVIANLRRQLAEAKIDADRWNFTMDFQNGNIERPEATKAMWRSVMSSDRLRPTREEYEAATDASILEIKNTVADSSKD